MDRRRVIARSLMVGGGVLIALWVICSLTLDRQLTHNNRTVREWSLDLLSPAHATRTNAARVLQAIGPEAIPTLVRQLHRRDSWLREPFLAVCSQLPVSWRRAFIRSFQPFQSRDERLAASTALVLFGTNVPIDVLLKTLRNPDRQLAGQAAVALGGYGAAAVPGLTVALREPDTQLRRLACYALSQIGQTAEPASQHLAALLSDPEPHTMAVAAYALTTIGPSSIPYFVGALHHPQPRVREKAAFSLSQFRAAATNAIPSLELLLDDEDPAVRRSVILALRAIAPQQFDQFGARHPPRDF